ncbi:MAG: TlpA family protein disulfide reductase [Myxococcales bacterium]|nr:TlpA family protein disulfide reductase [Myxococcales bacterium]
MTDRFGKWLGNRRLAVALLAAAVLLGLPLHLAVKRLAERDLLAEGRRAPVLQGPTLAGGAYDSFRDRGRVLVIVFLDPTLASSDEQGKALAAWRDKYNDDRAVFITVLTDGAPEAASRFAARYGLNEAEVVIDRGATRRQPFKVKRYPTVYVIDRIGVVRYAREGVVGARKGAFLRALEDALPPAGSRLEPRQP